MNKACSFGSLIRNLPRFPLYRASSFSSISAEYVRSPNFSTDEDEGEEGGSHAYPRVLKIQRPSFVRWAAPLVNSVSLIGHVVRPLQKSGSHGFGVYSVLETKPSVHSNCLSFRIAVEMRGDIAKMCLEHLKLNDFVYVSGRLGSYMKADPCGNPRCNYKIIVKELHYVAQTDQVRVKPEELHSEAIQKYKASQSKRGEIGFEGHKNPLHLWQLFFRSPHEWWDNRKSKKSIQSPDFRHKDTNEALWLSPHDPPWVKRQLQMLDLKLAEQCKTKDISSRSRFSDWVYDE